MAFHETQFPTAISYGSSGGPGFSTAIIEVDSGAEERTSRWSAARRRYNIGENIKSYNDLAELITFYIARRGPAHGFRYKDWLDFTTASNHMSAPSDTDQVIGTGDGNETQFQLVKKYTEGGVTRTRNITKPVAGTTVVALDGVSQASGWSVDTTTGLVTFTVAPALDEEVTVGCEFDVPVRFGKELDLTLPLSMDEFDIGSVPGDIPIVEIRDEGAIQDEFFFGGAADLDVSADVSITLQTGRVLRATSGAESGKKIILPDNTSLPSGGPYWYIHNYGANALSVRNQADVEVVSIAQDVTYVILLANDSGSKVWLAV